MTKNITIRMNEGLVEALRKRAEQDRRSLNQQIIMYIEIGMRRAPKMPRPDDQPINPNQ